MARFALFKKPAISPSFSLALSAADKFQEKNNKPQIRTDRQLTRVLLEDNVGLLDGIIMI
jgi:hypothetical protein